MISLYATKKLHSTDGDLTLEINTEFEEKRLTAIFGKSGAGKTTILRILAGLSTPDTGEITVDGEVWFSTDKRINLPPQKKKNRLCVSKLCFIPTFNGRGQPTLCVT